MVNFHWDMLSKAEKREVDTSGVIVLSGLSKEPHSEYL